MYYFAEDIQQDSKQAIKKQDSKTEAGPRYRLYKVINQSSKQYQAKGYWMDSNKLYKDKIVFKYYTAYNQALKQAENILHNTSELAVTIEDINKNILYIISNKEHIVLRIKYIYKSLNKRQAINKIKQVTASNGGGTLEYIKGYYIISSYK